MKTNNFEKSIITLIVSAGVVLAILQFIYNRSLWLDEAYLALNIIRRSHFELLKPLDYIQVGPVLFLQIEKLFSELIPNSEMGLRLFPLICYILSLFLFLKIVRDIFQNSYTIIFALSLFVFNTTLLYFSNEIKQYIVDVLVLTAIYFFVLRKNQKEITYYFQLGLVGAIGIFLSNVAPIILCTVGTYLLLDIIQKKKKTFVYLLSVSVIWTSLFAIYYFTLLHNHPSREAQIWEWVQYHAFLPLNPFKIEFYEFLIRKGNMIFFSLFYFGKKGGIALIILMLTGLYNIIRKRRFDLIILCIMPLMLQLLLSGMMLYPFDLRLLVYTIPCMIILGSFGFEFFFDLISRYVKKEKFKWIFLSIPLLGGLFILKRFPLKHVEIKESIAYIERHISKGDRVFVNGYSGIPFRYYKEISYLRMDTTCIIFGKKTPIAFEGEGFKVDTAGYAQELSLLSGRVWFLFTRIGDESVKIEVLKNIFHARGFPKIAEFVTKDSDVYLYDLGKSL